MSDEPMHPNGSTPEAGDETPLADALEAAAEVHDLAEAAADVTMAQAAEEAELLAEAGDEEGAEEALVEGAVEAAVMEETADEIGLELVEEAADREEAIVEDEYLAMEAEQGDGDLPVATAPAVEAAGSDEGEDDGADPFRGPGDWYVVHTYAGYENKVKANLESRIHTMQMEDKIFRVHIPMEDVMEIKSGKRQVVQKKVFPGYLLVRMDLDDDSWYVVRNTPGVTGFVGPSGAKPTPLGRKEVEDILGVTKTEGAVAEKKVRPRVEFEEGEQVRVVTGPFADFNGAISEIDVDRSKLKVLVNIFGRETPVELEFADVAKL